MKLKSMHKDDIDYVANWMSEKDNYRWLDFGAGEQRLEKPSILLMNRRDRHDFCVFTSDQEEDKPIGLIALSDISSSFKTATLWYILGDKSYGGQSYTTRAVNKMLTRAFDELDLETIFAWAVEINIPSVRVLEKNNFRKIGIRRKCHFVDGRLYDRLLFDLLSSEHELIEI